MDAFRFYACLAERIWGGDQLIQFRPTQPNVSLSPDKTYGESWEISDRPDVNSIVRDGPLTGKTLHELWTTQRHALFGLGYEDFNRFPLLCKILDVRDNLSLQIHPPIETAKKWHGEVKNEIWYVASHTPGARIYAGLKNNSSDEEIRSAIQQGTLANLLQSYSLNDGDSLMIPSGLLHGIGAGHLIYEIQQNSDTTYRLYDWNRIDAEGRSRELHLEQAFDSIREAGNPSSRPRLANLGILADTPFFRIEEVELHRNEPVAIPFADRFAILVDVQGSLDLGTGVTTQPGDFILMPIAAIPPVAVSGSVRLLIVTVPPARS